MATLASLRILLGLDAGGVKAGAATAIGDMKAVQRQAGATQQSLSAVGKGLAIGAAGLLSGALLKDLIELDTAAKRYAADVGAIGDEADRARSATLELSSSNLAGFDAILATMAKLRTDQGQTQAGAEALTQQYLDFAKVAKTDGASAVKGFDDALDAFNLNASDARRVMDLLFASNQRFGGSLTQRLTDLTALAPALQGFNLKIDDAIALENVFATSGLSASDALQALKLAVANIKPGQTFDDLIRQISSIENPAERAQKAIEIFGRRGGIALAQAFRPGIESLAQLGVAASDAENSVTKAARTMDSSIPAQFQLFIRDLRADILTVFGPAGPLIAGAGSIALFAANLRQLGVPLTDLPNLLGRYVAGTTAATAATTIAAASTVTLGAAETVAAGQTALFSQAATMGAAQLELFAAAEVQATVGATTLATAQTSAGLASRTAATAVALFGAALKAIPFLVVIGGVLEVIHKLADLGTTLDQFSDDDVKRTTAAMKTLTSQFGVNEDTVGSLGDAYRALKKHLEDITGVTASSRATFHGFDIELGNAGAALTLLGTSADTSRGGVEDLDVGVRQTTAGMIAAAREAHTAVDAFWLLGNTVDGSVLTAFENAQKGAGALGTSLGTDLTGDVEDSTKAVQDLSFWLDSLHDVEINVVTNFVSKGVGAGASVALGAGSAAGNIDTPPGATGDLSGTSADLAVAEREAEERRRRAQQTADDARRRREQAAAEESRKHAQEMQDALSRAYDKMRDAALRYFDTIHTANQKAIDDIHDRANAELDAQANAIRGVVSAERARVQAIRDHRRELELRTAVTAAGSPEDIARAQQALNDFLDDQRLAFLGSQADIKIAALDAEKTKNDAIQAAATAREQKRHDDVVQAFNDDLVLLQDHLNKATGHWAGFFKEIAALARKYGVANLVGVPKKPPNETTPATPNANVSTAKAPTPTATPNVSTTGKQFPATPAKILQPFAAPKLTEPFHPTPNVTAAATPNVTAPPTVNVTAAPSPAPTVNVNVPPATAPNVAPAPVLSAGTLTATAPQKPNVVSPVLPAAPVTVTGTAAADELLRFTTGLTAATEALGAFTGALPARDVVPDRTATITTEPPKWLEGGRPPDESVAAGLQAPVIELHSHLYLDGDQILEVIQRAEARRRIVYRPMGASTGTRR